MLDHVFRVTSLAFAPDTERLASADITQRIKIWDTVTGQLVLSLPGHSAHICGLGFHPDGNSLISLDESGTLRVWKAQ
jgi:WD40 repeat protein